MSNIGMIIEERATNLGQFMVGRLLPFRNKRMVGPFIFIDHMGPVTLSAEDNFDVPPHPHIGLSTLTYLFDGSIMHRDSLGNELEIKPGEVNWMTAGKGIVHSERTPEYLRNKEKSMHGLQIWVAMPKELEDDEPSFYHANIEELPTWEENGVKFKLIAGQYKGMESSVPALSPLFMIEIKSMNKQEITISEELKGEKGIYILDGSIEEDGEVITKGKILIAKDDNLCRFTLNANSTIYLFGGEPFPEERLIYWNFVSTSREKIEAAKERWMNQEFPKIPNENEFVPLPKR
jgi:hypothetical protein